MTELGTRRSDEPWPTATTRLLAVVGWPVAHSRSPELHNAALHADHIDACYLAMAVAPGELSDAVRGLTALGALGANVTVPHKQSVLALCDALTDEARLIGAVNTLHWTSAGLVGDNTDARGLVASLDELGPLAGRRALLIGAGGAARAAAVGLARVGMHVEVAARRAEASVELASLVARVGAGGTGVVALGDDAALGDAVAAADIVVNCTPLGLAGERLPDPCHRLQRHQAAVDLVYNPPVTAFLADARARGAAAVGGLGMLVHQAALSYERWTARAAPIDTMWAAARRAHFDGQAGAPAAHAV